jgi:hypothetical protein
MVVCIVEHVQRRWALDGRLARGLIKLVNIITHTSHYESLAMGETVRVIMSTTVAAPLEAIARPEQVHGAESGVDEMPLVQLLCGRSGEATRRGELGLPD